MIHSTTGPGQAGPFSYCVIIPTFNNAATLNRVIADVMTYTSNIIVVNDGSTDHTQEILSAYPSLVQVSYSQNMGKGWAIRQGFKLAFELGFNYAITMDADGQHFARDIPAFLDKIRFSGNALVVGARNMDQVSVPGKSSFGNRFSNFWFRLETGIQCPDTQSGFRLYPLCQLKDMKFLTRKYEFEIEVLVRAAWAGIPVEAVPVSVYYPPASERVSHFRPFKDFTRISLLNSVLVILTFFYIKPRNLLRTLSDKQKFRQLVYDQLLHPHQSDQLKAASIGFGIFMGIIPIWGFQLIAAIFLAVLLRLNKPLVIIAANISIPPMIPLIIFCSYKMGGFWSNRSPSDLIFDRNLSLQSVRNHFEQYILGSFILAIVAGMVAAVLAFGLLKILKRKPILAG
jgi:glycosyltransferase involved in cell wall biosynthesis